MTYAITVPYRLEVNLIKCWDISHIPGNTGLTTIISILNADEIPIDFMNRSRRRQASFILVAKND